jgi:hypothetical protein
VSRPFRIFALLALLAYFTPVRTCVLQEWTLGASCHDTDSVLSSAAVQLVEAADGCVPHPEDSHDAGCVCEQPKLSASRSLGDDVPLDLATPLAAALVHLAPVRVGDRLDHPLRPPDRPSPGRSLPLLI